MRKITDKDFIYVYDAILFKHLKDLGFEYVLKARSIKDGNVFTMYQKSEQIIRVIKQYNTDNMK